MGIQYAKTKSVAKSITARGQRLDAVVGRTMKTISSIVGSTLGPNGRPVLIERQEHDIPPMTTKDGVTVFRALGFDDPTEQVIFEAARDAAVRTAATAGDGTTTATVLAEAIVRRASEFTQRNKRVSPQKIVRRLEAAFRDVIKPTIDACSVKADWSSVEGLAMLRSVAKTSANGDEPLADAVLECFRLVGDDGNVTIAETSGASSYEVEKVLGFPIASGYEESCAKFYAKFINDPERQRCVLQKPVFLLYHGVITEIQKLVFIMENIGQLWQVGGFRHNVVVVATGFSESVLGQLAANFVEQTTINVFPLIVPNNSPLPNAQLHFLEDLAAITGARVLDPLNAPLERATIDDLGFGGCGYKLDENGDAVTREDGSFVRDGSPGPNGEQVSLFEAYAGRSSVIGYYSDDEVVMRASTIRGQLENSRSQLESILLQERLGRLTGGIARLNVIGASNGEMKEKRDRAEDAVCAVRAAIKHGCLPGGGWMLLKLMSVLKDENDLIVSDVLIPALFEPVARMLANCGFTDDETTLALEPVIKSLALADCDPVVYDAWEGKHVDPIAGGVLDATPAVLEAIRNSLSIASQLGTLGGTVVFKRDNALETLEARENNSFTRNSNDNVNYADEGR